MKERMCTHLLKMPSSASYYFRRKIPEDLIGHYNKKEIKKSLRTTDRREAERLARIEGTKLDQEFALLRQPAAPSTQTNAPLQAPDLDLLRSTLQNHSDWERAQTVVNKFVGSRYSEAERNASTLFQQILDTWRMRRDLSAGTPFYTTFLDGVRQTLSDNQYMIETGDFELYGEAPWKAEVFRNAARAFLNGDGASNSTSPLLSQEPSTSIEVIASLEPKPFSLLALVEKWERERQPALKTINMANRTVDRFRKMVGTMAVQAITRKHVVQFKDALLESGQSAANTSKLLTVINTLLNYAAANAIIEKNPASGVTVAVQRQEKPRISFDIPSLNKIFNSPVYTEDFRPKAGAGDAAFWLPLLALFTGARLEELGQLHPTDVCEESYPGNDGQSQTAWVMWFKTSKAHKQQVKNIGSNRRVPLHSTLIDLGFLNLVQEAREQKRDRIFHLLIADKYGHETAQYSKWFGRYLRDKCGVVDNRMTFHSFRHTFKELCRQEEITVGDALTGHVSGAVGDKYGGDTYPLRPLVHGIRKFKVPNVKLPRTTLSN